MSLSDITELSTSAAIADAVKSGEVSPVEVIDAAIQRIERRNPSLTYQDYAGACQAARQLEKAIIKGELSFAGVIVLGQTNSPVFGFRGTTANKTVGPTRNPLDLKAV